MPSGTGIMLRGALASLFLLFSLAGNANNGPRFIENKGQWPDQVTHTLRVANADVFFERDRLIFHFSDPHLLGHHHHDGDGHHDHEHRSDGINAHAYHVIFENAAAGASVKGGAPYGDVSHFLTGNDPSRWASGVKAFAELRYKDVYEGIDLHYFGHEGTLKYDVVVKAGANAGAIAMRYEGVDAIFLKNGKLHVRNTFNEVVEQRPVAYQTIAGKKVSVPCAFTLDGSTVGFAFPEGYDMAHELVIDPALIFSSFTGSVANNFGFTATYDNNGALYAGGTTFGANYPTTVGAYNNGFGGQVDMALTKFSPDGSTLIWSTYLGGISAEAPNSMVVNSQGQLVVLGSTSSANFPTTPNAFDQTYNGGAPINYASNGLNYDNGSDIVVLVLSADGSALLGSTFLGGSGNDGLNQNAQLAYNYGDNLRGEVIVDANDDIYITSSTLSANMPVTPGVFDGTLSGAQDAVVAKFNSNVSNLLWCGYLGGDGADAGYSLKLGNSGDLFVTGGTQGQNFPTTANALATTYQGGSADGFIARISNDGSTLERATYIGTSAYDQTFFVEVDENENVYVYGQSLGTLTLTPNVYFNTNGRQFIQRLDSDLSTLQLSTRFGSGGTAVNISPTAFLVDICDRIYISGWGGGTNNFWNSATGSTNNMPLTPDAFQSTTNGSDFYFMVMDADATGLLYATYFGGSGSVQEHVDGGTSRFDPSGVIYQAVCAGCGGSSAFPTTPGAWSNTNNAPGGCNVGVIKLDMEITGVTVEITAGDNAQGCAPLQVQFTSQLVNASDITWDFGDGNFSDQPNPTYTFTSPGTYIIALMGMDTVLCTGGQFADTAYATITVFDIDNPAQAGPDQVACGQGNVQIGTPAIAGYTYSWAPAVGLSDPNAAQPTASSAGQQTYTLTVTDQNGCQSTDQVLVDVFDAQASGDTTVCDGGATVQLGATEAASWTWSPAGLLDDPSAQFPTATVTESTQFTVAIDNGAGCIITREVTVQVGPVITVSAGADQAACSGGSVTLSGTGGVQFEWTPATYLNDPFIANPISTPEQNITYTLTATDQNGCTGTDQVTISVNQLPTITAAPATEVCVGDVVQLQSSGALTYAWSPAAGLSNPNSVSPQATMTETTTFTVTGTDANGCVNTAEVTVGVFTANATGQSGVCPGFTAQLGVDAGVSWNWSPANLLNDPTAQNPIATVNAPTTFNVAVSNGQGCVVVLDIPVAVFPPAAANAGPDRVACDGQPVTLNGSGGVQYQWEPATFLNDPTVQSPVSTPAADITYTLTVTDANGCVGTDQVSVAVLPSPVATASPDLEICIGQSTALTAEGGVTYSWSPLVGINSPNSATPTVSPAQTTTYVVTVTDANGCSSSDSVTVSVFNVSVTAIPGNSLCLGDSVQIVASAGTAFSWAPADDLTSPDAQTTFAAPMDNTTYTVTATAASGCEVSADVSLVVLPAPMADFEGRFIPTCDGVRATFINNTLDADGYVWDFSVMPFTSDVTNPTIYFPNGQGPTVTLTATLSSTGCDNSVTIDYAGQTFTNDSVDIVWTNVITPNGDGLNDCFKPGFIGEFSDCYELKVYNRWGALLFESVGTGNCWDGRTKAGNLVPDGTYYYIAKVLEEERAGWVQVVLD